MRVERVHERVVDQSVGVTSKGGPECGHLPVPQGMKDIVKAVGRLRSFVRVQQRTAEQVDDVPPSPGEKVEAVRFTTCEQVKQLTAEQVVHEPQFRQETVEAVRVTPRERARQLTPSKLYTSLSSGKRPS